MSVSDDEMHRKMQELMRQLLLGSLDDVIEKVRQTKYRESDYMGVVEISLCAHSKMPKYQKMLALQSLAELEWDIGVRLGLDSLPHIAGRANLTRDEYVQLVMANHEQFIDKLDAAVATIERDVANLPRPPKMDERGPTDPRPSNLDNFASGSFGQLLKDLATGAAKPKHG